MSSENILETYKIFLDSAFYLSVKGLQNFKNENGGKLIQDALILFQMSISKGISILNIARGIVYKNDLLSASEMDNYTHIDPTATYALIRTQLEAFCTFHNIFLSECKDQREFLHDLWVVAGLKERQRYIDKNSPINNVNKGKKELERINELIIRINNNVNYLKLSEKGKNFIKDKINSRQFQLVFEDDGRLSKKSWREMFLNSDVSDIFKNIYSNMSLYSHPSNVSVFQFGQMFEKGDNKEQILHSLKLSKSIIAFMIADICKYIPQVHDEFQNLPELNQLLIDTDNSAYRNSSYITSLNHKEQLNMVEDDLKEQLESYMS